MSIRFCDCAAAAGRYSTHSETCPLFGMYASPSDLILGGRLMLGDGADGLYPHPERYDCERDGMCTPASSARFCPPSTDRASPSTVSRNTHP